VNENVRAFFDGGTRRLQFGRMDRDANVVRVTFFNRCPDRRSKRIDRMILVDDLPDLHEVGFLLGQFAHELARLIRAVDLDDRRITQIELLARDAGD